MEKRLADVQLQMNENLQGSARRTAHSLGELQQRLTAIDKAQENITNFRAMFYRFRIFCRTNRPAVPLAKFS